LEKILFIPVVVLGKSHPDGDKSGDEDDWGKKIANLLRRCAEAIRVARFVFIFLRRLAGLR
jgi:hypothetical protein